MGRTGGRRPAPDTGQSRARGRITRMFPPGTGAGPGDGVVAHGYEVARRIVPQRAIDDALRLLHLDLLDQGASAERLGEWLWSLHWFPHLIWRDEITQLAAALPEMWRTGTMCDPQILLQFPHTGPAPDVTFHVDQEPAWAGERRYSHIVGVALSPWRQDNGGLLVEAEGRAVPVELDPGDVVVMAPDLPHSGGVNLTGGVRYGVYFRWLA